MKFLLHGGRSQEGLLQGGSELNGENGIEVRNCLGPACLPACLPAGQIAILGPFSLPSPPLAAKSTHTHAQRTAPIPKTRRTFAVRLVLFHSNLYIGTSQNSLHLYLICDFVSVLMTYDRRKVQYRGSRSSLFKERRRLQTRIHSQSHPYQLLQISSRIPMILLSLDHQVEIRNPHRFVQICLTIMMNLMTRMATMRRETHLLMLQRLLRTVAISTPTLPSFLMTTTTRTKITALREQQQLLSPLSFAKHNSLLHHLIPQPQWDSPLPRLQLAKYNRDRRRLANRTCFPMCSALRVNSPVKTRSINSSAGRSYESNVKPW